MFVPSCPVANKMRFRSPLSESVACISYKISNTQPVANLLLLHLASVGAAVKMPLKEIWASGLVRKQLIPSFGIMEKRGGAFDGVRRNARANNPNRMGH